MNSYRRGAVLGLTVAETFILLAFLLLFALLGLTSEVEEPPEDPPIGTDGPPPPRIWVAPEQIETLERGIQEARMAKERAEQALRSAESERDDANARAKRSREAEQEAKRAQDAAERDRDREKERAEQAFKSQKDSERAMKDVIKDLDVLRRKGENPPCWYEVVDTPKNPKKETREKAHYAFNVAIYENSIVLAPREAPPLAAFDDFVEGSKITTYAKEREDLGIGDFPYGVHLTDRQFQSVVENMVAKGRNEQVRTYECVFSVMVWDKTPNHAKDRWKYAHDRIIEGSFGAYTAQDLAWPGR